MGKEEVEEKYRESLYSKINRYYIKLIYQEKNNYFWLSLALFNNFSSFPLSKLVAELLAWLVTYLASEMLVQVI